MNEPSQTLVEGVGEKMNGLTRAQYSSLSTTTSRPVSPLPNAAASALWHEPCAVVQSLRPELLMPICLITHRAVSASYLRVVVVVHTVDISSDVTRCCCCTATKQNKYNQGLGDVFFVSYSLAPVKANNDISTLRYNHRSNGP